MKRLALAALLLVPLGAALLAFTGSEITGRPYVTDGDSLRFGRLRVRLHGIDAPELDQVCATPSGSPWPCGVEAKDMLRRFIGDEDVTCAAVEEDRFRRIVATCAVRGYDLGHEMVVQGMALSFRRYSLRYVGDEEKARAERRGMWAGTFEAPWDFRRARGR